MAHRVGELSVVVELPGVDRVGGEGAKGIEDHRQRFALFRRQGGEGEDQVLADLAQEDALGERAVEVGIGEVGVGRMGRGSGGGHAIGPGSRGDAAK
jgi:hypothetical protein